MSQHVLQDPEAKAVERIRTAVWAAVFLGVLNLAVRMLSAGASTVGGTLVAVSDPVVMLGLASWLHRKRSRAAAIALLVLFLLGKLVLWLPLLSADLTAGRQDALASALARQLFMTIVMGYAFIQGIRGTSSFALLHRAPARTSSMPEAPAT